MGRTSCQVGAWREGTQIGHNRSIHDHVRYGGGESVFVCFSSESSVMPTYCFVSFHLVVLVSHSKVLCLNFFLALSFSWEMLQGYSATWHRLLYCGRDEKHRCVCQIAAYWDHPRDWFARPHPGTWRSAPKIWCNFFMVISFSEYLHPAIPAISLIIFNHQLSEIHDSPTWCRDATIFTTGRASRQRWPHTPSWGMSVRRWQPNLVDSSVDLF